MKLKNRPIDILIGAAVTYLFLGAGVVSVQALSGAKCGPIQLSGFYVYTVNVDAPRAWWWRVAQWLPTAWDNVVTNDVPVADFISPRECLWVPEGKTPAEVLSGRKKPLGET